VAARLCAASKELPNFHHFSLAAFRGDAPYWKKAQDKAV
jgi:hypothetical protein